MERVEIDIEQQVEITTELDDDEVAEVLVRSDDDWPEGLRAVE